MKASETSLRNLLEGTKQFQIPLFQRPYSWEKENWETLWADVMSLYMGEVEGFYFLGPIVTQAVAGTAEGISPFIVIDGQQRLTTLTILLATLRNYLKKIDPQIAVELYELYLINKFKKDDDFYKVLPTQADREVYKSIIQGKQNKELKKEGKLYEAYKFFSERLKKPEPEYNLLEYDHAKFKTILLESLLLVNITSDDRDNPYLIFESLNNKGQELTQADLVRNYIFMRLPHDQREEVYNKDWLPLQNEFKINTRKREYTEELTNALWFYLRKDGAVVSQKEIYKSLKERLDKSKLCIQDELKEVIRYAKYYQYFNFESQNIEQILNRNFKRFLRLDFTACQIFLLNIYSDYEKECVSIEDFERILQYLESYFVRRWFTAAPSRMLSSIFPNLYNKVKEENSTDLVNGLRTTLKKLEGNLIWPKDDSFRDSIINQSIYSSSSNDRVKLVLERIEESLSKEWVDPQNLTIEHIMPQKLNKEWQKMIGINHSSTHKKWVHTLGNLTLTGYNSELSNKPFKDKLFHFNHSSVSLNKHFSSIDIWNEDAIKSRGELLADIAIKVWPR